MQQLLISKGKGQCLGRAQDLKQIKLNINQVRNPPQL